MERTNFLIIFILISILHASFLAWSKFGSDMGANISSEKSLNSTSIKIKSKRIQKSAKKTNPKINKKAIRKNKIISKDEHLTHSSSGLAGQKEEAKVVGDLKLEYPYLSKVYEEEGTVFLRAKISSEGRVLNVSVLKSSGFPRLDNSALITLKKAKFLPAMSLGKPVTSIKNIEINFELN